MQPMWHAYTSTYIRKPETVITTLRMLSDTIVVLQMYSVFGTLIYASMSGDASCFGVISPTNGPVVMEFTQGEALASSIMR